MVHFESFRNRNPVTEAGIVTLTPAHSGLLLLSIKF